MTGDKALTLRALTRPARSSSFRAAETKMKSSIRSPHQITKHEKQRERDRERVPPAARSDMFMLSLSLLIVIAEGEKGR